MLLNFRGVGGLEPYSSQNRPIIDNRSSGHPVSQAVGKTRGVGRFHMGSQNEFAGAHRSPLAFGGGLRSINRYSAIPTRDGGGGAARYLTIWN